MESAIANRTNDNSTLVQASRGQGRVVLQVENLRKHYGSIDAVAGVSFKLREGEVFGLLGLNGAGKTTLISMLSTRRHPSGGDALVLGHSIRKEWQAIRRRIGVAPQEDALYPMLTGAENLHFFGRIYDIDGVELEDRIAQMLHFVGLHDRGDDRVANYSGGMKRRLNLAAALIHQPDLVLLDEPTAGVDPESREDILNLVRSLRDGGTSILYTTHYMEEAEELCDEIGILEKGKLVALGTLDDLLSNVDYPEIVELRGLSPQADLSIISGLNGIGHVEQNGGMVRLFVKRAVDLLEPLQKIISRERSAHLRMTPITLENLFLHLTGRKAHAGKKIYE